MNAPNDLNFDIETYLLFSIYYNAYQGYKNGSAAGYLQRFANEIRGAGQVLEWLGLAKPDNQSRLGWMPSNALVSLIVNPRRSKSKKDFGNAKDLEVFDMIFDATVGDDEEWSDTRIFVISVLTVLGLAKKPSSIGSQRSSCANLFVSAAKRGNVSATSNISMRD
jgi:hypothetical protein